VGLKQKYGEIINAKRKKEQKMSTDFITKHPFSFKEVMDKTDLKIFEEDKHNGRRTVCLVDPKDQYIWLGFVEGRTDIVEVMTRFGGNEVTSMLIKISNAINQSIITEHDELLTNAGWIRTPGQYEEWESERKQYVH
tara:strand:- start:154 stop:564 length:411 start_codon:yes stop_codon:yes gene_type:complete